MGWVAVHRARTKEKEREREGRREPNYTPSLWINIIKLVGPLWAERLKAQRLYRLRKVRQDRVLNPGLTRKSLDTTLQDEARNIIYSIIIASCRLCKSKGRLLLLIWEDAKMIIREMLFCGGRRQRQVQGHKQCYINMVAMQHSLTTRRKLRN